MIGNGDPVAVPHLRADLRPKPEARDLRGQTVVAFAGIGRPEKFFAMLKEMGGVLAATHAFADHHPYREKEILALAEQAQALDAVLVTTAKDHVRLPPGTAALARAVAVDLLFEDRAALDALLAPTIESAAP